MRLCKCWTGPLLEFQQSGLGYNVAAILARANLLHLCSTCASCEHKIPSVPKPTIPLHPHECPDHDCVQSFARMNFFGFVEQYMEEGAGGKGNEFEEDQDGFAEKSAQAIPGDVRMISGCKDAQTSADVSNVQQFGLPEDAGPGGAGGACTNAFLAAMEQNPNPSWTGLLRTMRNILSDMACPLSPAHGLSWALLRYRAPCWGPATSHAGSLVPSPD